VKRTLTITLDADWQKSLRLAGKTVSRGIGNGKYQGEFLNFESAGVFFGKLTERRWDIVRALQAQGASSIRQLAKQVDRDVRRVHDDVSVLLELGLLEKTDEGQVICPFTDIHVDMHLVAA
jgi:predicted transcriptional regulator